jgi:predicted molibdopterin-dependent oxidoreductase YjgC
MADEISISFDGVEVKTSPGKMVLEAAIEGGVYIPYLCYHPGMKPFAACRMCVVGVEGGRGFPASCTLPVQDGMKIRNEADDVQQLRRSVMDMLVAEHPNGCLTCHRVDICSPGSVCLRNVSVNDRCVTCPKNERCELKDTVRYLGIDLESPLEYKYRNIPLELGDPFYDRDYNLCIVCGRCVRACEELRGDDAIGFTERSGIALVGTSFGTSLLESGCEFCGACIDVCPVGALVEKDHKWEKPVRTERTICPHCPVGCQLNLEVNASGQFIRAVPELNSPANRGQACFKGKFGLEFVNRESRLRTPLVRRDGQLHESTWDEALDHVASRLAEYKGDGFALLTSPNSTNEEHYLAQKFARAVMQSNNIDQTSNTQPELVIGLERSLGYAAATNSIWDLEHSDCILVFNSNVTEEHNVVGVPIKKAARKTADLVVIDPREVELTRYARLWLRPVPGTELLLLGGILKSLIDQGLEQTEWLEENCESPATLHYALHALELEEVSRTTHVSQADIAEAARLYGQAGAAAIVYALDNVPAGLQKDCVRSLVDLALVTGNLGKPGSGLYPMRQGANEQGAWDMGCLPGRLPGYGQVTDDVARQRLETAWGCVLPPSPGLGAAGALQAAKEGRVKAMLIVGDSINLENGKLGDGLAALEDLDFLVVLDTFLSPAAERASVVLPRTTFAEKEGTFTNLERRIQLLRPVFPNSNTKAEPNSGADGARTEAWVIEQLAGRMGADGFSFGSPAGIMDEIALVTPIYGGISHRRLEREGRLVLASNPESPQPTQVLYSRKEYRGIQWPCPDDAAPGVGVLYRDGFPSEKGHPITPEFRAASGGGEAENPMWLVPGRVLIQRERDLEVVKGLTNQIVREDWIELNPADANRLSIVDGDQVEVASAARTLSGVARLVPGVPAGVIAVTGLFGQLAIDLQASEEWNPAAESPRLEIAPASIAKVSAGSAA